MKPGRRIVIIVVVLAVIVGAVLTARYIQAKNDAILQGSGTVEARYIRVGSKVGGRIDKVLVREGDRVKGGQILATFDDKELQASLEQSRAAYQKAHSGSRPEDIAQSRAATAEAKAEWEQRKNGYRREDIAAAQSDLDRATAEEVRTQADFERYEALSKKDLVSRQQRDSAEAAWKMSAAAQRSTQEKLAQLKTGYRSEEVAGAEARYKQMLANQEKMERGSRVEDIDLAKAAFNFDTARARESQVVAPSEASVEVLDIRPGDLIAPNVPIATLLESDQIYIRIYIPETEIGRVHLGQQADVRVDSFPNKVFNGVVEQINAQAEFLPRNVQTRSERVHEVIGVKVRVNDSTGVIRSGMAADVKLQS